MSRTYGMAERICTIPPRMASSGCQFMCGSVALRVRSQLHFPVFADDLLPEADALLAADQLEAGLPIDVARGREHAVGPERDLPVAGTACEADALISEPRTKPEAARLRLDQEQPQSGDINRLLRDEHAADILAVHLGDPTALALRIVGVEEIGDDFRADALEGFLPAVFLRVQLGMALNDPAEIAMAGAAQDGAALPRLFGDAAEQRLDRAHRRHQSPLVGSGELAQHVRDVALRFRVERTHGFLAACGQRKMALPRILRDRAARDEAALLEFAQEAAQIGGIETERAADVGCGRGGPLPDLVQHARFTQRVGAVEKIPAQHADLPRVEAVETANRGDPAFMLLAR